MKNTIISGCLKKKGSTFGFWHKRYCSITENKLFISKNMNINESDRIILIDSNTLIQKDPTNNPPRMIITPTEGKSITLSTNDMDSLDQWILALRSVALITPNLSIDDFNIISVIGRGFYGKVMLCQHKTNNEYCAIKTIHKNRLIRANKIHTIFTEKNVLLKSRHPFIVSILFAFQTDTKLYLGLEYASGGELFYHLQRRGQLPISESKLIIAELALAINFLHENKIIYRDLKPENVLLDSDGHVKLTDFGLAKDLTNEELTNTFCGTSEYVSPEVISRRPYSYPIDWWSLGILLYEILIGMTPFVCDNKQKMFQAIRTQRVKYPPATDKNAINLINGLLNKEPEERFNFQSIKNHPFFEGLNWDDILLKKIIPEFIPENTHGILPKNFDSQFTKEIALDSLATPIPNEKNNFQGFSYMADEKSISSDENNEVSPSILTPYIQI